MSADHMPVFNIEVNLTPNHEYYPYKPYFWIIYEDGANCGAGWAKTPEDAWKEAYSYYLKYKQTNLSFGGDNQ